MIPRIYHSHEKWEEVAAGMWKSVPVELKEDLLVKAIEFTGNAELYGSFMMRVTTEWPFSCEHNLTADINRQAWIGHAAVALAFGCPEDITRMAWHHLTQEQQDKANAKADAAIRAWEIRHEQCPRNTSQLTFFHLLESA